MSVQVPASEPSQTAVDPFFSGASALALAEAEVTVALDILVKYGVLGSADDPQGGKAYWVTCAGRALLLI